MADCTTKAAANSQAPTAAQIPFAQVRDFQGLLKGSFNFGSGGSDLYYNLEMPFLGCSLTTAKYASISEKPFINKSRNQVLKVNGKAKLYSIGTQLWKPRFTWDQ